jgi:hypothetical protein
MVILFYLYWQKKRLKDKLGYKGRSTVFHSYRNTVITLLHNAHVSMELIAGIAGHTDDMNFTLNEYSDGLSNKQAINRLQTPPSP